MLNDFIGPLRERLTTALEPLVAQLRERLDPLYAQAATLTVDAGGRSPEEIALDILGRLDAGG